MKELTIIISIFFLAIVSASSLNLGDMQNITINDNSCFLNSSIKIKSNISLTNELCDTLYLQKGEYLEIEGFVKIMNLNIEILEETKEKDSNENFINETFENNTNIETDFIKETEKKLPRNN